MFRGLPLALGGTLGALVVLAFAVPPTVVARPDLEGILHSRIPGHGRPSGTAGPGRAFNMELIASHDLGQRGFNADVWVHRNFAYIGQWGFGDAQHPDRCPSGSNSGVKVVDVGIPRNPRVIATLQNPPGTTAEDVQVLHYTVGPLAGRDIALVGIQACFRTDLTVPRGLQLFDVTHPARPREIGFLPIGPSIGVHEFWAFQRGANVYALLAVPFSMLRDDQEPKRGDVRITDVTDPRHPREIADWSSKEEGLSPDAPFGGFGCFPYIFGHSAFVNRAGTLAFVSHWDLGTVILDITDAAHPTFVGRTRYPPNAEGDGHSVDVTVDERFLFQADEVIPPNSNCQAPDRHTEKGWGYLRVYDLSILTNPPQVGFFKTARAASPNRQRKGDYSIHNPFVRGNKAYASWYSDGVRVLDITNPAAPIETAFFVPPPTKDPLHVLGFVPEVWGVVVDERGCVFLSEMNFGLYIVRETGVGACQGS